jgi:serine/threonine protein kinase
VIRLTHTEALRGIRVTDLSPGHRPIQIAQRDPPRHGVAELSHVARPGHICPHIDELGGRSPGSTAQGLPEVLREQRNVVSPLAQRRQLDACHGQAMEEVIAKTTLLHLALEIAPGGQEQSHVATNGLRPAHAPDLGALDRAQQLRLQWQIQIADFVDEQGSALGELEQPFSRRRRAGEGAALVSEQLGLDQAGGDGRTIEDDERKRGARTGFVQRLGQRLLARARFPLENDGDQGRRQALAERVQPPHREAGANEAGKFRRPLYRMDLGPMRDAFDAQARRSDAKSLPSARISVDHLVVVDPCAVGRTEVGDSQTSALDLERQMAARDRGVHKLQVGRGPFADQQSRGFASIDANLASDVEPIHDLKAKGCALRAAVERLGRRGFRDFVVGATANRGAHRPASIVVVGEAENVSRRRTVGRYRLYEAIAAGGMATVHYGRMQGPVGFARTVAIKRLHPEYARDPEFVAMFMDEARLAARVHHPNVVQTLDVVLCEGELFLVMEYVPAVALSHLLQSAQARGERAPAAVAAAIVADVLRGLHAAHEATDEEGHPLDIVHRDVSPQNILLGTDGNARVLDFGVAKATGRAAQATREGQVKGKFAYMAPEQVTNVCVTRQSDIFAASIVLWEALTGRRLFQAESEPALLARVLSGPIEAPSTVVPELGGVLDGVVLRGLSRDLSARYVTARDMVRDLETHTTLASGSQVSEWVERLAGEPLAERAARVAEIENESRSERVSVATVLASSAQPPEGVIAAPPLGAGDATSDARAKSPRKSGRRRLVAVIAAAVIATAVVGLNGMMGGRTALRAAEGHGSNPASASVSPAELAPATDLPTTQSAIATATHAIAPNRLDPPRSLERKAAPARSSTPPTPARAGCDPPYYLDPKGHLIYKAECFR